MVLLAYVLRPRRNIRIFGIAASAMSETYHIRPKLVLIAGSGVGAIVPQQKYRRDNRIFKLLGRALTVFR
jgi:hypothetical protein